MNKSVYQDSRGWKYKVMTGLGGDTFKARYCKPRKDGYHCCRQFDWQSSFDDAQVDLDVYAQQHGWRRISGDKDDDKSK